MTVGMELVLEEGQPAVNLHTQPHALIASPDRNKVAVVVNRLHRHVEDYPDVWALEHVDADTDTVDVITRLGQVSTMLNRRYQELRTQQANGGTHDGEWELDRRYGTRQVILLIEDLHHVLNPRAENLTDDDREQRQTAWFLALRLIRLGSPAGIHLVLTTTDPDAFVLGREFTDWIDTNITDS